MDIPIRSICFEARLTGRFYTASCSAACTCSWPAISWALYGADVADTL